MEWEVGRGAITFTNLSLKRSTSSTATANNTSIVVVSHRATFAFKAVSVKSNLTILTSSNTGIQDLILVKHKFVNGIHAFREIKEEAIEEYGEERNPTGRKVAIRRFDWKTGAWTLGIAIPVYFALVHIIRVYAVTHGGLLFPSQPWWDAFIAVGSMVGTFFLSKSYMCQWYIWLVLNTISVGVFVYSGMYWIALMYVVYIVLGLIGLRNWRINGVYVD